MSVHEFDEITPLELDFALKDHTEYHNFYTKQFMLLMRYIGVILRNKGLRERDIIRNIKKFWIFPWEWMKKITIPTKEEWKMLDKKYSNKRKT